MLEKYDQENQLQGIYFNWESVLNSIHVDQENYMWFYVVVKKSQQNFLWTTIAKSNLFVDMYFRKKKKHIELFNHSIWQDVKNLLFNWSKLTPKIN